MACCWAIAGLAVVLLRTLIERRSELALLEALGFRRRRRMALVLAESGFLLGLGLLAGLVCALIGVGPALVGSARGVDVGALAAALAVVLVVGLGAQVLAMSLGARRAGPADLRPE